MNESVLYFRIHNLLIKFDGLYWWWSPKDKDWILDQNLAIEHCNNRNFIRIPYEEVKKYL